MPRADRLTLSCLPQQLTSTFGVSASNIWATGSVSDNEWAIAHFDGVKRTLLPERFEREVRSLFLPAGESGPGARRFFILDTELVEVAHGATQKQLCPRIALHPGFPVGRKAQGANVAPGPLGQSPREKATSYPAPTARRAGGRRGCLEVDGDLHVRLDVDQALPNVSGRSRSTVGGRLGGGQATLQRGLRVLDRSQEPRGHTRGELDDARQILLQGGHVFGGGRSVGPSFDRYSDTRRGAAQVGAGVGLTPDLALGGHLRRYDFATALRLFEGYRARATASAFALGRRVELAAAVTFATALAARMGVANAVAFTLTVALRLFAVAFAVAGATAAAGEAGVAGAAAWHAPVHSPSHLPEISPPSQVASALPPLTLASHALAQSVIIPSDMEHCGSLTVIAILALAPSFALMSASALPAASQASGPVLNAIFEPKSRASPPHPSLRSVSTCAASLVKALAAMTPPFTLVATSESTKAGAAHERSCGGHHRGTQKSQQGRSDALLARAISPGRPAGRASRRCRSP